jgi:undecaprenyl-diphosphatase
MSLYEMDNRLLEWINHNRIRAFDNYFIWITDTAYIVAILVALVVLFFGVKKRSTSLKTKGWQLVICLCINSMVVNILKYTINRDRPFEHNHAIEKLSTGGSPSFPSGHTADAFVIAVLLSFLFSRRWVLLLSVWCWAILVAYSRMSLGVHYPSDVLGSMLLGLIVAIAVYFFIYKNKKNDALHTLCEKNNEKE